ncbi:hypothetical protein Tco_0223081 [Tanacetum coccineum]
MAGFCCAEKLISAERERDELRAVNADQASHIKELEAELARKDSTLVFSDRVSNERAAENERLVSKLGYFEKEKIDSIGKLLLQLSGAGWAKGLTVKRSEKDIMDVLREVQGFDPYSDTRMTVEYDKLFTRQGLVSGSESDMCNTSSTLFLRLHAWWAISNLVTLPSYYRSGTFMHFRKTRARASLLSDWYYAFLRVFCDWSHIVITLIFYYSLYLLDSVDRSFRTSTNNLFGKETLYYVPISTAYFASFPEASVLLKGSSSSLLRLVFYSHTVWDIAFHSGLSKVLRRPASIDTDRYRVTMALPEKGGVSAK